MTDQKTIHATPRTPCLLKNHAFEYFHVISIFSFPSNGSGGGWRHSQPRRKLARFLLFCETEIKRSSGLFILNFSSFSFSLIYHLVYTHLGLYLWLTSLRLISFHHFSLNFYFLLFRSSSNILLDIFFIFRFKLSLESLPY